MCRPAVPLLQETPNRRPASAATASSNAAANGPRASTPLRGPPTSSRSRSPIDGPARGTWRVPVSVIRLGCSFRLAARIRLAGPLPARRAPMVPARAVGAGDDLGYIGRRTCDVAYRALTPVTRADGSSQSVDLRRQTKVVGRWLPLIVASVVLAGVAALYVSSLQTKVYEARVTLIVGQSLSGVNPDYNQLLVSQSLSRDLCAGHNDPAGPDAGDRRSSACPTPSTRWPRE